MVPFAAGGPTDTVARVLGVAMGKALKQTVNTYPHSAYADLGQVILSLGIGFPLGVIAGLVASWTLLRRDVVSLVRR